MISKLQKSRILLVKFGLNRFWHMLCTLALAFFLVSFVAQGEGIETDTAHMTQREKNRYVSQKCWKSSPHKNSHKSASLYNIYF